MEHGVKRVFCLALLIGVCLVWATNHLSVRLAGGLAPAAPSGSAVSLDDHLRVAEALTIRLPDASLMRVGDLLAARVTVVLVQWNGPLSNGLSVLDRIAREAATRPTGRVVVIPLISPAYWTQTKANWPALGYSFPPALTADQRPEDRKSLRYLGDPDTGLRSQALPLVTVLVPGGRHRVDVGVPGPGWTIPLAAPAL
ncbi:MAG: hypothetical protein RLY86_2453 [Pseudomonadota bacterium]|jgi:hypothetical protein